MIAARGVHHLAIQVRDLTASERFYCDILGLPVVRRWPAADGAGERSIWVDTGDGAFLALEVTAGERRDGTDAPAPPYPAGLHLVALRIDAGDRRAWRDRFERAGIAVYHHTAFTIYVRDPEGNRVGLSHYPVPATEASG